MEEETKKGEGIIGKFRNKYFLIILGILIFAFFLRMHYIDTNKAVWWDEADYLSLGRYYGQGTPQDAAPWRARGFSMVFGIFYFLGANEWFIRFLEVLVSVASVYLTYLMGRKLYSEFVGLTAAFCMSTLWIHLFWTARISMGVYGLTLWLLISYLFWDSYVEGGKTWKMVLAGGLIGFGIFGYESLGFIMLFLGLFLLFTDRWQFFKSKKFWMGVAGIMVIFAIIGTQHYFELGSPYPRVSHIIQHDVMAEKSQFQVKAEKGYGFLLSEFTVYWRSFPLYLKTPFLIIFLLGLTKFVDMFVGFDMVIKNKKPRLRKDFFLFIWICTVLLAFSFYEIITGVYFEPRYLFPMYPAVFIVIAFGLEKIYDIVKKHNRQLAIVTVLGLLAVGAYPQITYADMLIKAKADSFAMEPVAGKWLKENSEPDDLILSCSQQVPLMYHSERLVRGFSENNTRNDEIVEKTRPRYMVIDMYYQVCNYQYLQDNPDKFKVVQGFFLDQAKKQPIIVIYEVNYDVKEEKEEPIFSLAQPDSSSE